MTTEFWLWIAALCAVALAILLPPLFRRAPISSADGAQRNTDIARQQVAELKQQLQSGALSPTQYEAQYNDLQLSVLDTLDDQGRGTTIGSAGRWVAVPIAILLPVGGLLLYGMLGEPEAMKKAEWQATNQKLADNVQTMVQRLVDRLQQQPDDVEGWMMLGRSFVYMQEYQKAAEAFGELNRRKPGDPAVMLRYADALSMARNGRMSGEPADLVFRALEQVPEDHTALWLAGMAKAEAGDFRQAIVYWQKLSKLLPADDEAQQQLANMMRMAEAEMVKAPPSNAASAPNVEISVRASLANGRTAPADNTVFIYAQAANGPKMPLAIVRKQVADLPIDVVLNDSMAMQPQLHLADFPKLRIVARVSKSGNAMPAAGDLIGSAELNLADANRRVNVTIDQEVK
ncbi:c-type cytochrome biogenesis protein CcmI [Methylomonas sp. LWB]|uniref:c-type cytochrome biogenesis protein CcmI n=1 Tax=Methylomonas sp. LWB TaxID=1905845 RepID=UPI0008D9620D|nr:c-type cytochrome biogenesis protein CcmI [Methylomonas sp. LWB]OHX37283.1 c-type cytochrome biogenesis protein CcmI [Methylomonas sp. LWB]